MSIIIDGKPTRFVEHRIDDGYNSWFSQQYLQSVDQLNGQTIRISKFKLDSITAKSFKVTMYIDFYDPSLKLLTGKSKQVPYWFNKKDIIEVLVKSKQL